MAELIGEATGFSIDVRTPRDELAKAATEVGIDVDDGWGPGKILLEIYEKTTEAGLWGPVFVIDYPAEVSPLARRHRDGPDLVERYEPVVAGRELGNGFTELTDPDDQRARFEEQAAKARAGDDEESAEIDEDYLRALEYGLPPTSGFGLGVDRLAHVVGRRGQHPRGHRLSDAATGAGLTLRRLLTLPLRTDHRLLTGSSYLGSRVDSAVERRRVPQTVHAGSRRTPCFASSSQGRQCRGTDRGIAGVAGASSPARPTPARPITPSTTAARCSPQLQDRVQTIEGKLSADLPKAQAREAKLKAKGHTKLANAIANRITKVQGRDTKVNARLSKIQAECGDAQPPRTPASASAKLDRPNSRRTDLPGRQPGSGRSLSSSATNRASPARSSGWAIPAVAVWPARRRCRAASTAAGSRSTTSRWPAPSPVRAGPAVAEQRAQVGAGVGVRERDQGGQRVDPLGQVLAGGLLQLAVGGGDVQDVVADLEHHAEAVAELGAGLDLAGGRAPVSAPMRHDVAVRAAVLPLMAGR